MRKKQRAGANRTVLNLRRLSIIVAACMTLIVGSSGVAFANGTWSNSAPAQCSTTWYHNTWGATATLHYQYTADTDQTSYAQVTNSKAWIDSMRDCGPEGRQVTAYRVDVVAEFWIYANTINCSLSISGDGGFGVDCADQGSDDDIKITTTCYNAQSCTINMPSLYFYPNDGRSQELHVHGRYSVPLRLGGQHATRAGSANVAWHWAAEIGSARSPQPGWDCCVDRSVASGRCCVG